MKNLRRYIKAVLRENAYSEPERLEMAAAYISAYIGDSIMSQGFDRVESRRGETRFMNRYLNGVDVMITTQVDFSDDIKVFFKIRLEGVRKTNSTRNDMDRINTEYGRLFDSIMGKIDKRRLSGNFGHLGVDFGLEHFVDGL